MLKKVINKNYYIYGYSHHYAVYSEDTTSIVAKMYNWPCFGKLKTSGIKEAILVAPNTNNYKDAMLNYYDKTTDKETLIERNRIFKEVFKEIPSLNVFKGGVFKINGMSCIKLNLDISGPNLAKGLFFFRGVNKLTDNDFNLLRSYNNIEDKIIHIYIVGGDNFRQVPSWDAQPWERFMDKSDIIRFIKAVHKGSFIENPNFKLIETSRRYRNRRVDCIELPDRTVGYYE